MGKTKEIFNGWKNLLIKDDYVELIAKKRIEICNSCDENSRKKEIKHRPDFHCTACGCTLAAKTRSLESACPMKFWPSLLKLPNTDINEIT
jgi:hypothetical protein